MSAKEKIPYGGDAEQVEFRELTIKATEKILEQVTLKVFLGDYAVHTEALKLSDDGARSNWIERVVEVLQEEYDFPAEPEQLAEQLQVIYNELNAPIPPYKVVTGSDDPEKDGIYEVDGKRERQITNFEMRIERQILTEDAGEYQRRFDGYVALRGVQHPFSISAQDYSDSSLVAAIYSAAGVKVVTHCKPEVLRRAVSCLSTPTTVAVTRAFGWTPDGDAYLFPSGSIDATGFHPAEDGARPRVDLSGETCARYLDLRSLGTDRLRLLKEHVVTDFFALHDRAVTYSVLAAVPLAILQRFATDSNREALWLVGLTGAGKSFIAKLVANFFGDFPVSDGSRVGSFTSTANFLQQQGHYHKDAIYVIDDYKVDVTRPAEIIKLFQNYADGSARGRLNADSTAKSSRAVRGMILATGEATPEHTASALARTVVIPVRDLPKKNVDHGHRCMFWRSEYSGLTAAFIHHVLAHGRAVKFAARVESLTSEYVTPIVGQLNDLRIAGNLALLGAAFEEMALFLSDAWPQCETETRRFVDVELPALRDQMIARVAEQKPSVVFLEALRTLIAHGHVRVRDYAPGGIKAEELANRPMIGTAQPGRGYQRSSTACRPQWFKISTGLALGEVQKLLIKQGLPALAISPRALIDQLGADQKLLDEQGRPFAAGHAGERTRDIKLDGRTTKAFRIAASELTDHEDETVQGAVTPLQIAS